LAAYLHDRAGVAAGLGSSPDTLPEPAPWTRERRVGLARTPDRTASDGMLYSDEHLRMADGTAFAARCLAPADGFPALAAADAAVPTVRFGGEGRRAQLHLPVDGVPTLSDLSALPGTDFADGRVLLYLATPALFAEGWRPDPASLPPGVTLVAAAVAGPRVVSTARADHRTGAVGNTRLLWAADAGSVYYLHIPDPDTARAFADACHDRLLVHTSPFPQIKDDIVTAGFGLGFIGRW
jgi:CRISPR-associated protein Cmr3